MFIKFGEIWTTVTVARNKRKFENNTVTAKMRKCLTKFSWIFEFGAVQRGRVLRPEDACQKRSSWFSDWSPKVQKCVSVFSVLYIFNISFSTSVLFSKRRISVNLVDLVKSFQTSIYLQNSASIQPRTGLSKFAKK